MATEKQKIAKKEAHLKNAINAILAHERSKKNTMPEDLLEKIGIAKKIVETEAVANVSPVIVNTFAKYKAKYVDNLSTLYSFKPAELLEKTAGTNKNLTVYWQDANYNGEITSYSASPSASAATSRDHVLRGFIDDTFRYTADPSLLIEKIVPDGLLQPAQYNDIYTNYRNIHTLPPNLTVGNKYSISFQFKLRRFPSKTHEKVLPEILVDGNVLPGRTVLHKYFSKRTDLIEFVYGDPAGGLKIQFGAMQAKALPRTRINDTLPKKIGYYKGNGPFSIAAAFSRGSFTNSVYTDYKFLLNTLYTVTLSIEVEKPSNQFIVDMKVNQIPENIAHLRGKVWSSSLNWLRSWSKNSLAAYKLATESNVVLASQPGFLSYGYKSRYSESLNRFLEPEEDPKNSNPIGSVRYFQANNDLKQTIQNDFGGHIHNLSQIKAVPYEVSSVYSWIYKQKFKWDSKYFENGLTIDNLSVLNPITLPVILRKNESLTKEYLGKPSRLPKINNGVEITEININAQLVTITKSGKK